MQYNTFRQAHGIPMATTFCTNHIRQAGVSLYSRFVYPVARDLPSITAGRLAQAPAFPSQVGPQQPGQGDSQRDLRKPDRPP